MTPSAKLTRKRNKSEKGTFSDAKPYRANRWFVRNKVDGPAQGRKWMTRDWQGRDRYN